LSCSPHIAALDWLEFTLLVPAPNVETAADVLRRHCPGGVSIEQPILVDEEEGYALDTGRPVSVRAYLPRQDGLPSRRRALRRELRALGLAETLRTRWRREEEWADAWKKHFRLNRVGRELVICPTWIDYSPVAGEVLIRLDPGMAFGTGEHPTTQLCLESLETCLRPTQRVLDLGTGSGILAIAAALMGAERVIAVDINPVAVSVARENVAMNSVQGRVLVLEGSLDATKPPFDLILANISSAGIIQMAPELARALAPEGTLVASGIGDHLAGTCRTVLQNAGLRVRETIGRDGWCALVCTQP
jgi:ribosomal protein L11 methyltransferase